MNNTSLYLGIAFLVFDTAIYLYYGINFWKKVRKEHKLIVESKAVYRNISMWNFIKAQTFAILPILLIYSIIAFSLNGIVDKTIINYVASFGYAIYTLFVLIYVVILSFGTHGILIALYNDSIIMMDTVIKANQVYAIDFNNSRKHVYLNYVVEGNKKEMVKLRNQKKLLNWLEENFKKDLFVY